MKNEICPYFPVCGGCLYMNLSDVEYKAKKEDFIKKSFLNFGIPIEISEFISIPLHNRRRVQLQLNKGEIGFNAFHSNNLVAIDKCLQLTNKLNQVILILKKILPFFNNTKGKIALLETPFGVDMEWETNCKITTNQIEVLSGLLQNEEIVRIIYNKMPLGAKVNLEIEPFDFMQPSLLGVKTIYNTIEPYILPQYKVVDLFCGYGTFTKPLEEKGILIQGFDISPFKGANKRDLYKDPLNAMELNAFDCVILDPPRLGALAQIKELAQALNKQIIYISCNPTTCARDISYLMQSNYCIQKIVAVDQFIYSNHIEIVVILKKAL